MMTLVLSFYAARGLKECCQFSRETATGLLNMTANSTGSCTMVEKNTGCRALSRLMSLLINCHSDSPTKKTMKKC